MEPLCLWASEWGEGGGLEREGEREGERRGIKEGQRKSWGEEMRQERGRGRDKERKRGRGERGQGEYVASPAVCQDSHKLHTCSYRPRMYIAQVFKSHWRRFLKGHNVTVSHISITSCRMNCYHMERQEGVLFWRAAILGTWQTIVCL